MKRIAFCIIFLCISSLVFSACSKSEPATGPLTMPDYTTSLDGVFARFDNGAEMILNSDYCPVILKGGMDFSGLNSGDYITIYCNAITESYPGETEVLEMVLHKQGGTADLPSDIMEDLKELGYEIKEYEALKLNSYTSITMAEFSSTVIGTEGDYIILDVRRADEFASGHIPGAINIANESINDEPPALLPDKDQTIYVYCRSGNRSKQAAGKLAAMGYTNIIEFGGILDWPGEIEK